MKQNDIAVLAAIIFFSAIASFLISGKLFVTDKQRKQTTEVVDVINVNFPLPDERFFNDKAINPTTNSGLEKTNENPFTTDTNN
ncbi:hypothetical protein KBC77_04450 [Candidatus Saccharibacteria bacterium]|nr:hypothetical protein [Candidatus Saccharibacteria bacterium]